VSPREEAENPARGEPGTETYVQVLGVADWELRRLDLRCSADDDGGGQAMSDDPDRSRTPLKQSNARLVVTGWLFSRTGGHDMVNKGVSKTS
jgi:hypothetical protein